MVETMVVYTAVHDDVDDAPADLDAFERKAITRAAKVARRCLDTTTEARRRAVGRVRELVCSFGLIRRPERVTSLPERLCARHQAGRSG